MTEKLVTKVIVTIGLLAVSCYLISVGWVLLPGFLIFMVAMSWL